MSLTDDLKKIVGIKPRYPHVERELAHAYGLTPERLKEIRTTQLQRGPHWDLVKGLVCYNDAGRQALEAALAIVSKKKPGSEEPAAQEPAAAPDSAPNAQPDAILGGSRTGKSQSATAPAPLPFGGNRCGKNAQIEPAAGEVRTLVAVAKVRNKRILKARDEDRVAWVRVRDSKNFRAGMELQAKFISGEQWELVGRCPRWNGKF